MSSSFDKALSTLSSTSQSIFSSPVYQRSLPVISAGALSLLALSYFFPSAQRSADSSTRPLIKKGPQPSKNEVYDQDFFKGGHYVSTPYGQVKVYESGPEDGAKLLLVHGITTPSTMWKDIVPRLTSAGFRVMVYDLYGRGYSDAPIVIHDVALYVSQISFIISSKPDWQTFNIVGMSLGGPIVANFVHHFPARIQKVFLMCPVGGTPLSAAPLKTRIFRSLPNSLCRPFRFLSPVQIPTQKGSIAEWQVTNHPGFVHSFFSCARFAPIYDQAEIMKSTCKELGDRIETVWGDSDDAVALETKEYFAGSMKIHVIPGGGHLIPFTHSEKVTQLLIDHIKS